MNIGTIILFFALAALPGVGLAGESRPRVPWYEVTNTWSETNLPGGFNVSAKATYEAAGLNIIRDVAQKRVRIYAVRAAPKTGPIKEGDFNIEVIYYPDLARLHEGAPNGYHVYYNEFVFEFAASQYSEGKKELGLRLLRLLAEAEPDIRWLGIGQPPVKIQQILAGLEKNDASVKEFLREPARFWKLDLKDFAP